MTTLQPLNYSTIPMPPRWARVLMRPIGWPFFVLAIGAALWTLWEGRLGFRQWKDSAGIFVPLGVIWIFRASVRMLLFHLYRQSWIYHWQRFVRFGVVLWIPIVTVILAVNRVPERVAFRISESAMQRLADSTIATGTPPPTPVTAGCLPITDIYYNTDSGIVHFWTGDRYSSYSYYGAGYAFAPEPPTIRDEFINGCQYKLIHGHWYKTNPMSLAEMLR